VRGVGYDDELDGDELDDGDKPLDFYAGLGACNSTYMTAGVWWLRAAALAAIALSSSGV
jgi:hypothetical protein